jgi:hypothetical protein
MKVARECAGGVFAKLGCHILDVEQALQSVYSRQSVDS